MFVAFRPSARPLSTPLPGDLPACHEMLRQQEALIREQQQTLAELGQQKQSLQHRLEQLLRRLYGRRSERLDAAQLLLFGQALEAAAAGKGQPAPAEGAEGADGKEPRRRGRPHGRRPLPEHLPRVRIEHPVDPKDLVCHCGRCRYKFGEVITEQLERAAARLFVLEHVRFKFACICEDGVVTADLPPQPIDKGLPGPGLIAYVVTSKYADHLPLYRLEGMLAREGVDLDRSTLGGWIEAAADLLMPLLILMSSLLRQCKVIGTDDTTVPVLDPKLKKTRIGHLWAYVGDATQPHVVFDYTPDHGGEWPAKFLAGFEGFLQADAFSGYDALYSTGKIVEVGCMAHARRKFYEAKDSDPVPAHQALAFIRQLYEVEAQARELDAPARQAMRHEKSAPVLDAMHAWLLRQQTQVLPKSPMAGAIGYALNHWAALCIYVTDGDLSIDNNFTERQIKLVALGRKNWMFAGSDEGGKRAAVHYSFVATCKRHGVDPLAWYTDVLARIPGTPLSQIGQFLPDRWKAAAPDATATPNPGFPPSHQRPPPRPAG